MGILVLAAGLFHACTGDFLPAVAEFENQTSYSITVTIVGSEFSIASKDAEGTEVYNPSSYSYFTVSKNQSVKIRSTVENGTINFRWTGGYEANRKVYVVNNGSKVTFKE
jgi:hypothetical protein